MEPGEAAKRVFICYRQLDELLRTLSKTNAHKAAASYNTILKGLKECFAADKAFLDLIQHLKEITVQENISTYPWVAQAHARTDIETDGSVLRGTAHAFIEMYLSPEEKKKAIGFQSQ